MPFALSIAWLCLSPAAAPEPIWLSVDATQAARNLFRVEETFPVKPGQLNLHFPKWIPGEHQPTGPISGMVQLHFDVEGQEIPWSRDPVDLFTFHLWIPARAKRLTAKFTIGHQPDEVFSSRLGRLKWNRYLLLPDGKIGDIQISPKVTPPDGWTVQTALPTTKTGASIEFATVSAERLVDSPLQMGAYAKSYTLRPWHILDVLAEEPSQVEIKPKLLESMGRLVDEESTLFGAKHYGTYHFLNTFSSYAAMEGLEHHESSENGENTKVLDGDAGAFDLGDLMAHEMFHSWNGKHRRPAGLAKDNFTDPQETELLWVYEGLTQYYGHVLATRAGFFTPEVGIELFAAETGAMDVRSGRTWRPLADTAVSASILRGGDDAWHNDRRRQDYYSEMVPTWLEVDATIRKLSKGAKSLDDFCRAFHGGVSTGPQLVTYTFKDVVAGLNAVAAYDWESLLRKRIYDLRNGFNDGLAAAGWKLVYTDQPNKADDYWAEIWGDTPGRYDLGMVFEGNGNVKDVFIDGPAERALLAPGMKILVVNGRPFTQDHLWEAVTAAKGGTTPISLTVEKDGHVQTLSLPYYEGRKFPHLVRVEGTTDYLTSILTPRAKQ